MQLEVQSQAGTLDVEWVDPVFVDANNQVMEHACNVNNNHEFSRGLHTIVCYPTQFPSLICNFTINVTSKWLA